jgi:hypothetical protein
LGHFAAMKPFEIFRAGTHTSSEGTQLTFTDADLASIVAGYNTALHHAPIVVGHPKQDKPAYGWVDAISVKDDRLVATPADVDASFSDLVKGKKFRKVSAAFYQPQSPNNPTPGSYYLRHVGFLGAAAPAVKGLKQVEFADDTLVVTFEDTEFVDYQMIWGIDAAARLFRGVRDWLIESKDLETANRVLPEWDIGQLAQTAADLRAEKQAGEKSFAYVDTSTKEEDMPDPAAAAALATREAEITRRETLLRDQEKARRSTADASFVDGIVKAGKLPIGLQATATALFADLGEEELTFAEGTETKKTTPHAAFRVLLDGLPVPVVTKELASGDGPDFSDPQQVADAITGQIKAAADKGDTISVPEAARRLNLGSTK